MAATQIKFIHLTSNSGSVVVGGRFIHGITDWQKAGFTVKNEGPSSVPNGGTIWELKGPSGMKFSVYGGRTSPGEYRDYVFE